MNEADTRAELIDPKIRAAGWGEVKDSVVRREFPITKGEIKPGGIRAGILKADYILVYKNRKIAAIEAKSNGEDVSAGVAQAKDYAQKLKLLTSYSCNGKKSMKLIILLMKKVKCLLNQRKRLINFHHRMSFGIELLVKRMIGQINLLV